MLCDLYGVAAVAPRQCQHSSDSSVTQEAEAVKETNESAKCAWAVLVTT